MTTKFQIKKINVIELLHRGSKTENGAVTCTMKAFKLFDNNWIVLDFNFANESLFLFSPVTNFEMFQGQNILLPKKSTTLTIEKEKHEII
jgi:hypothetical protein